MGRLLLAAALISGTCAPAPVAASPSPEPSATISSPSPEPSATPFLSPTPGVATIRATGSVARSEAVRAAADPDAATVGRLAIEMKRLQEQVQHTLEESNKALDGILDDEQRTRLEQLRGAAGACGVIPAFKAIGLL